MKGTLAPRSGIDEREWPGSERGELACSCVIMYVLRCPVLYGVDFCFEQSIRCVANRARILLRSLRVLKTFVLLCLENEGLGSTMFAIILEAIV